ncbi:chemotaxis protein CheV [Alkalicoccobacillus murimartini]|uniref:Two-component system chemotaxis response regulator CheV n=1 Tax=Alkalicoccobacillus murimartini TaxID=171685 RepID=A0ABT9YEE7_9BACI|nr:chemotaxis protein [Alkalicoccobacillus murimartini]MDQ0206208.1 two-component system chemotaxis response regulator CheV [Alkalicoccobacillus murimartini]
MTQESQSAILLESGTNELELVMFKVGQESYGINVLKVREIVQPVDVTSTPNRHPYVEGVIRIREEIIPLIDLSVVLQVQEETDQTNHKFVVAELNKLKVAFRVHNVSRIHRVSWSQVEKPNELSQGEFSHVTGIVKMEEYVAFMLDYEKIVVEIHPDAGIKRSSIHSLEARNRTGKRIVVAEDSGILRQLLKDTLSEAGYSQLVLYENGQEAWDALNKPDANAHTDLIITDIEMPLMDGHRLTKLVKEHDLYKDTPVIIFSSIISDDLFHKGQAVGANGQVSKPEILSLIQLIDSLLLNESS